VRRRVASAAIVDAVRPRPGPALDAEAAAQLAELGVTGTLVYTDPNCDLHALSLPGLEPASLPRRLAVGCEISVSPDGSEVGVVSVRWSADATRRAICRQTCAWRQSQLTFAVDGEVHTGRTVLVPRRELAGAVRMHPNAPAGLRLDELRVLDLVWTSAAEVVALIEARYRLGLPERQTTVAAFRNGRLAWQRAYAGGYERLVVSSAGDVLLEPAGRTQGPLFAGLDPAGPIDWSPGGGRLAVATRASVFVVDLAAQRPIRIR
jgi:hypothetical protein